MPSFEISIPMPIDESDADAAEAMLEAAEAALSLAGRRQALARVHKSFAELSALAGGAEVSLSFSYIPAEPHGEDELDVEWLAGGQSLAMAPEAVPSPARLAFLDAGWRAKQDISAHALAQALLDAQPAWQSGRGRLLAKRPEEAAHWFLAPAELAQWLADSERRKLAAHAPAAPGRGPQRSL